MRIGEMGGETCLANPEVVAPVSNMLTVLAGALEVLVGMVELVNMGIETGIVVSG